MGITRYFKVSDQNTIDTLKSHIDLVGKAHAKANETGKEWGFEREDPAAFRRWGMWDSHLAGFFCGYEELNAREDKEFWTKIKDGTTRPKKNKKSPVWAEYSQLCKEVESTCDAMDDIVGFNKMTFYPCSPGCYYNLDKNILIFSMPIECDEVKGAEEISNMEYMTLTNKEGASE